MFSHRSFLMLDGSSPSDILSLIKGGYEILDCNFSFQQGIDQKGKTTTRVYGGSIQITLSQLPTEDILDWSLRSRKYRDGVIVTLDQENVPLEKIYFKNATCTSIEINFTQKGKSYASTKITIQTEKLIVGSGIDFTNEWKY